jgi:hypothetical protein
MWRLVAVLEIADFSEEHSAFIFNGQRFQDPFILKNQGAQVSFTLQNEGTTFFQTSAASKPKKWCDISEKLNPYRHDCNNLNSTKIEEVTRFKMVSTLYLSLRFNFLLWTNTILKTLYYVAYFHADLYKTFSSNVFNSFVSGVVDRWIQTVLLRKVISVHRYFVS